MAEVAQSKVSELYENCAVLEDKTQAGNERMRAWRIGSTVYYNRAEPRLFTCLDEIKEGEAPLQGQFHDQGSDLTLFVSVDNQLRYYIPTQQLSGNGAGPHTWVARRNNKLWKLNRPDEVIEELKSNIDEGSCQVCGAAGDGMTGLGGCNHGVHRACFINYVKANKMLTCPAFLCKKPVSEAVVKEIVWELAA